MLVSLADWPKHRHGGLWDTRKEGARAVQITNQISRTLPAMLVAGLLALLVGVANSARAETVVLTCTALTTDDNGRMITGRYTTRINTDAGSYTTDGTDINMSGRAVVT